MNDLKSAVNRLQNQPLSDTKHYNAVSKSKNRSRNLIVKDDVYYWPDDGNLFTTSAADMPILNSPDYNAAYAVASGPYWPIPKPQTSPDIHGMPYAANVGTFTFTRTFTGDSKEVTYIMLTTCPEAQQVVLAHSRLLKNNNYSFPPTNTGDYKTNNAATAVSNWTQVDPRLMISGLDVDESVLQQTMGGEVRFSITLPWQSIATVAVLDPLLAPSYIGNKLPNRPIVDTSRDYGKLYSYYGLSGTHVHGGGSSDMSSDRLYNMGTSRHVLTGGGTSSTMNLSYRLIPNTQSWTYLDNNSNIVPGPFTGHPIIMIELPANQTVSVSAAGWVSYNVTVNPQTAVGSLLSQKAPIATFHATNVKNIPITVVSSTNGNNFSEMPYAGTQVSLPNPALYSGAGVESNPSLIKPMLTSLINNLAPKFKQLINNPTVRRIGATGLQRAITYLAQKAPTVARTAAPLLLTM